MTEGESRREFFHDMKSRTAAVDRALVVDEMETVAGYLRDWVARCRNGDVEAWILYGRLNYEFWELAETLEDYLGMPDIPGEPAELDG